MHRLKVPDPVAQAVLFLIEHHLDLSLIMNGRDLEDPATARFLTSRVPTPERLRSLALLTYADISAVNPTAMTPWRMEQLWRVYAMGLKQMNRELSINRVHASSELFAGSPVSDQLARFIEGLPTRYLRIHPPDEIEHHAELYGEFEREGVAAEIEPREGSYLLTVLAPDRTGLFASICGALASFGMNIVKAEAAPNARRCILDLIRFTDPTRTLELNPSETARLEQTIRRVILGTVNPRDLLKGRRPPSRPTRDYRISPVFHFNNEASDSSTLIEFVGEDRPGLLYDLASALSQSGCNIELVMIDTQAHKALDVFYVTRNGEKLDPASHDALRQDLTQIAGR
jgi:[protein-PII] uridylyltransferase